MPTQCEAGGLPFKTEVDFGGKYGGEREFGIEPITSLAVYRAPCGLEEETQQEREERERRERELREKAEREAKEKAEAEAAKKHQEEEAAAKKHAEEEAA